MERAKPPPPQAKIWSDDGNIRFSITTAGLKTVRRSEAPTRRPGTENEVGVGKSPSASDLREKKAPSTKPPTRRDPERTGREVNRPTPAAAPGQVPQMTKHPRDALATAVQGGNAQETQPPPKAAFVAVRPARPPPRLPKSHPSDGATKPKGVALPFSSDEGTRNLCPLPARPASPNPPKRGGAREGSSSSREGGFSAAIPKPPSYPPPSALCQQESAAAQAADLQLAKVSNATVDTTKIPCSTPSSISQINDIADVGSLLGGEDAPNESGALQTGTNFTNIELIGNENVVRSVSRISDGCAVRSFGRPYSCPGGMRSSARNADDSGSVSQEERYPLLDKVAKAKERAPKLKYVYPEFDTNPRPSKYPDIGVMRARTFPVSGFAREALADESDDLPHYVPKTAPPLGRYYARDARWRYYGVQCGEVNVTTPRVPMQPIQRMPHVATNARSLLNSAPPAVASKVSQIVPENCTRSKPRRIDSKRLEMKPTGSPGPGENRQPGTITTNTGPFAAVSTCVRSPCRASERPLANASYAKPLPRARRDGVSAKATCLESQVRHQTKPPPRECKRRPPTNKHTPVSPIAASSPKQSHVASSGRPPARTCKATRSTGNQFATNATCAKSPLPKCDIPNATPVKTHLPLPSRANSLPPGSRDTCAPANANGARHQAAAGVRPQPIWGPSRQRPSIISDAAISRTPPATAPGVHPSVFVLRNGQLGADKDTSLLPATVRRSQPPGSKPPAGSVRAASEPPLTGGQAAGQLPLLAGECAAQSTPARRVSEPPAIVAAQLAARLVAGSQIDTMGRAQWRATGLNESHPGISSARPLAGDVRGRPLVGYEGQAIGREEQDSSQRLPGGNSTQLAVAGCSSYTQRQDAAVAVGPTTQRTNSATSKLAASACIRRRRGPCEYSPSRSSGGDTARQPQNLETTHAPPCSGSDYCQPTTCAGVAQQEEVPAGHSTFVYISPASWLDGAASLDGHEGASRPRVSGVSPRLSGVRSVDSNVPTVHREGAVSDASRSPQVPAREPSLAPNCEAALRQPAPHARDVAIGELPKLAVGPAKSSGLDLEALQPPSASQENGQLTPRNCLIRPRQTDRFCCTRCWLGDQHIPGANTLQPSVGSIPTHTFDEDALQRRENVVPVASEACLPVGSNSLIKESAAQCCLVATPCRMRAIVLERYEEVPSAAQQQGDGLE